MEAIKLAAVLDISAAAPLKSLLLAHRGQDIELDAAQVVRLGGQCLQVLLAANRTWHADGRQIRLVNLSDPCRDALNITKAGSLLGTEA